MQLQLPTQGAETSKAVATELEVQIKTVQHHSTNLNHLKIAARCFGFEKWIKKENQLLSFSTAGNFGSIQIIIWHQSIYLEQIDPFGTFYSNIK